jgi:rSAM/selenodomain-associated transferase 2
MRISVIVPTLNAAAHLPDCLHVLREADEIIISDGGSTDATQQIARDLGARLVEGSPGRGVQLAAGAEAATHPGLLFVHADTRLGPKALALARAHLGRSPQPACFCLQLDDEAWQARWIERAVLWRTRFLQLPYGDQGLALRREQYEAAGGFRAIPLMEDVDLIRRLAPVTLLEEVAVTSTERWRTDGWAHRSLRNLTCLALWRLGVSPQRIAALYQRRRPTSRKPQHRAAPAE